MGYVEETGAAQHLRDARITPIYEGTTGIQAADLIGRKIARDGGAAARALIERMRSVQHALDRRGQCGNSALARIGYALDDSLSEFEAALRFLVECSDPRRAAVGAVPFLALFGIVAGGWQMGVAALAAQRRLDEGGGDDAFLAGKLVSARVYAAHVLPRAAGLRTTVVEGADAVMALHDDYF